MILLFLPPLMIKFSHYEALMEKFKENTSLNNLIKVFITLYAMECDPLKANQFLEQAKKIYKNEVKIAANEMCSLEKHLAIIAQPENFNYYHCLDTNLGKDEELFQGVSRVYESSEQKAFQLTLESNQSIFGIRTRPRGSTANPPTVSGSSDNNNAKFH